MRTLATLLLLAVVVAPAMAQEQQIRAANLPRDLEIRLLRMYDGGAERLDGPVAIRVGEVRRGDIAVTGGPLHVAGRLEGNAAMVDGDVVLEAGGEVTGSITVIGGEVRMADETVVGGTITTYGAASDWRRPERDRAERGGDPEWRARQRARRGDQGYSRLTVRTGVSYNRVEGLPVMFGPVLETAGPTPLRLEAFGIWRTETGGSPERDRMGYQARAEQFLARDRALSVGGSVYSVVEPLDRWQVSDLEASLGTFLFHQDLRDHYDRTGWSAFARVRPAAGLDARVTYRDERHAPVPVGDPWALFNRSDDWRLQPVVAEGAIRSLGASVELDRRDRRDDPREGWLARVSAERPVSGSLVLPALGSPVGSTLPLQPTPTPLDTDFTTAFLDVRRYSPVGDRSQLNLRAVAGGSLTERALPPQYQHALGGPGTLPGYQIFHGDCGARGAVARHGEETYFAGYGCDRFTLGQVEYRGRLSLDFGFGERRHDWIRGWKHGFDVQTRPVWVVFANAGRGWGYDARPEVGAVDTGVLVDAGLGFLVGKLGLYVAVPLSGDVDQSPRFFLRWGPRF
jgi:hypothetical protein